MSVQGTSFGLDVHAVSVVAHAVDEETGQVARARLCRGTSSVDKPTGQHLRLTDATIVIVAPSDDLHSTTAMSTRTGSAARSRRTQASMWPLRTGRKPIP